MDALELAYTPHPAARPRVTPMAVAASSRRADETRGLAAAAVTGLALFGAAALMATPGGSTSSAPVESVSRPFETRTAAQVQPSPEPAPVEIRSSSPLPLAGDALGPEPAAPVTIAAVAAAPREQHVLTSFDGTRTMTDGPAVAGPSIAPQRRDFPPAPVVWNHPVQWISVHKQGL